MAKRAGHRLMAFMSKHMIACDEAGFLISLREDRSLGFRRWWQLSMHLLSCHLCRKYAHQIRQLNNSMEHYREQCGHESCEHHLSSEAGSRINKEVTRELNAK
jgi:hypothetical protein